MEEKILKKKKYGMLVLILSILIYAGAIATAIIGGINAENGGNPALLIVSLVILGVTWLL